MTADDPSQEFAESDGGRSPAGSSTAPDPLAMAAYPNTLGPTRIEDLVRNDFDAKFLALLWCVKKAFFPMLWFGLIAGMAYFLVIESNAEAILDEVNSLNSPGEIFGALASPFSFVAIALVTRIGVGFVALGAAYPLVSRNSRLDYPHTNRPGRLIRMWSDRWKMASAYRSVRWTWQVRHVVLDRMDAWGTWWRWWDILMIVLSIVLGVVAFVMLVIATAQLPPDLVSG